MIILIENGIFHEDISNMFGSIEDARASYGTMGMAGLDIIECDYNPDLCEGWTWDGSEWTEPYQEGLHWIVSEKRFIGHDEYRVMLHAATTNDTLQALRKIREGDKEIDWEAWLDALDEYNRAVEDTTNQKDYPLKVVYPEYPVRPTV